MRKDEGRRPRRDLRAGSPRRSRGGLRRHRDAPALAHPGGACRAARESLASPPGQDVAYVIRLLVDRWGRLGEELVREISEIVWHLAAARLTARRGSRSR